MPKPSAQKVYHNPLIYARFSGLFLYSFGLNHTQSLSGVNFWKESSKSINFLEDSFIFYSVSYLPEMSARNFWKSSTTLGGDTIFAILRNPASHPKNWSLSTFFEHDDAIIDFVVGQVENQVFVSSHFELLLHFSFIVFGFFVPLDYIDIISSMVLVCGT